MAVAAVSDLRDRVIPNWVTFPAIGAGLVAGGVGGGLQGLILSLLGLGLGVGLLLPFYLRGAMGAGDVKLLGALGAILGPLRLLEAFFLAALVGGAMAGGLLLVRRRRRWRRGLVLPIVVKPEDLPSYPPQGHVIPYGVAIALGTVLSLILPEVV